VTSKAPTSVESPLLCARCAAELQPGAGNFYRVTIEAVADPTPPDVTAADLARDHRREIERLIARMAGVSQQEALDQVCRRLILYLCGPCYRVWIEDPTG
jgi:hypothetical protein